MTVKSVSANKNLLHTFSIDHESEIDGRRYLGDFTVKRMSVADYATLGVRKAQLNGGMHFDDSKPGMGVDQGTDELNGILSHLDVCVKKAPEWWKMDEIADIELIYKIYKEVMAFENTFRGFAGRNGGADAGSGEGTSAQKTASGLNVGPVAQVVGSEVSTALEP